MNINGGALIAGWLVSNVSWKIQPMDIAGTYLSDLGTLLESSGKFKQIASGFMGFHEAQKKFCGLITRTLNGITCK